MPLLDSLQIFSLEAKNGHYRIGYLQLCNQTSITLYEIMQWLIFPKSVKMVQEIWSGMTFKKRDNLLISTTSMDMW